MWRIDSYVYNKSTSCSIHIFFSRFLLFIDSVLLCSVHVHKLLTLCVYETLYIQTFLCIIFLLIFFLFLFVFFLPIHCEIIILWPWCLYSVHLDWLNFSNSWMSFNSHILNTFIKIWNQGNKNILWLNNSLKI